MSTLDFRNLPGDRLATTDEEGRRMWIIPARVRGVWKNRKAVFHIVLLAILLITPWLRYKGEPIILLDLVEGQFTFFGQVYGAHDGPMIFFILAILALSLALVTAIWGRVWCGWACPQTVFIEQVFRRIEGWIIGNRAEQVACYKDPIKPKHFFKILLKWMVFFFVSALVAHSVVAYFVSWEKLMFMMTRPPAESWTVFLFVMIITLTLMLDFGWFREQFCIIMCPYGRFQSVLLDNQSITVAYDHTRGEKRSRNFKNPQPGDGDCIDCYKCVSVCPTGIDIRNGQQMECIACTACIDACDEVMEKVKRPKGLIRYASLAQIDGEPQRWMRSRVVAYALLIAVIFFGLVYSVINHRDMYYSILRRNQQPYAVNMENGQEQIINNYRLHLRNPNREPLTVSLKLNDSSVELAPPVIAAELAPGESRYMPFFVKFKGSDLGELRKKRVKVEMVYTLGESQQTINESLKLVGPKRLYR